MTKSIPQTKLSCMSRLRKHFTTQSFSRSLFSCKSSTWSTPEKSAPNSMSSKASLETRHSSLYLFWLLSSSAALLSLEVRLSRLSHWICNRIWFALDLVLLSLFGAWFWSFCLSDGSNASVSMLKKRMMKQKRVKTKKPLLLLSRELLHRKWDLQARSEQINIFYRFSIY